MFVSDFFCPSTDSENDARASVFNCRLRHSSDIQVLDPKHALKIFPPIRFLHLHPHNFDNKSTFTMASNSSIRCILDPTVVNADTLPDVQDIGLSFFASLCGRNRGAFVLHPSDGHTWGCTSLPPNFAQLAGLDNDSLHFMRHHNVTLTQVNDIKDAYTTGNLTAQDTVQLLDYFIQVVYESSANIDTDLYACNVDGLAQLDCPKATHEIRRAVTLAGLFAPAVWATGGEPLTLRQARDFYVESDFADMKALGINTVQIPFPLSAFDNSDDDDVQRRKHLVRILAMVDRHDLQAILLLQGAENDDAVTAAAHFCADHAAVWALTLPSPQLITAARAAEATLPLLVTIHERDLLTFQGGDHIYASLVLSHTSSVGDIASSTALDDRMKMFYHEATSCIYRSPLEHALCHGTPVFVQSGFDLAIDDCYLQDLKTFVDYGQCNHFNETIDSPWWQNHRRSLASRQMFAYERGGLGWSFAAWKLYNSPPSSLTEPAQLLALKDVAAAGLLSLNTTAACLNPPVSDFIMGDATYAPTPAPPPDCGNGWWNYTIQDCTYWVPPPATAAPTAAPCPQVETKLWLAAGAGALVAVLASAIVSKLCRRRSEYSVIPDLTV
jgi:hypothetical protein